MADALIENIIDGYLQEQIDEGMNSIPVKVEPEMSVPGSASEGGWHEWVPIASTVTDEEIAAFRKPTWA